VGVVLSLGFALLASASWRLRHLRGLARAAGAQRLPGEPDARAFLRRWLAWWFALTLATALLFVLQENLELARIGQPLPGMGVLASAVYPHAVAIIAAVALVVSLVAALFGWKLDLLIARIRGLLRRREWLRASAAPPEPKDSFVFGDKSIHFDLLELRVRGQIYPLTVMEASVLRYLVEHEDKAVSRKAMLQDVWGLHEDTDTRAIDNFIVRLRRYLENDATRPRHLLTVRGVGYRFVAFPPK